MAEVVRIRPETYKRLKSLADHAGKTLTDILDEALDQLQRKQFLEECNLAYARLRRNPKKWKEYKAEIAAWDATLQDGLESK